MQTCVGSIHGGICLLEVLGVGLALADAMDTRIREAFLLRRDCRLRKIFYA